MFYSLGTRSTSLGDGSVKFQCKYMPLEKVDNLSNLLLGLALNLVSSYPAQLFCQPGLYLDWFSVVVIPQDSMVMEGSIQSSLYTSVLMIG